MNDIDRVKKHLADNTDVFAVEYPYLVELVQGLLPNCSTEEHDLIIQFILDLCPSCKETVERCYCWNDR